MLKMGLIGGGPGSMIGDVHRVTAEATGRIRLVCGCFSTDPKKSQSKGAELGLLSSRVYTSIDQMLELEAALPKTERMDFVAITTPNHLHVEIARKCINSGFHVMCDKPLGISLAEGLELKKALEKATLKFGMTYTYRGYSAIEAITRMINDGEIGEVRKVMVDYSQGWLSELAEDGDNKQASWRTDPSYSGAGGTIADIGTHAFNLAESIVQMKVVDLVAQVSTMVEGRNIDDDANMLIRFENGATGTITVGQALAGEDNSLRIQVYGSKGGLVWNHNNPNEIILKVEESVKSIIVSINQQETDSVNMLLEQKYAAVFLKGFIHLYDHFAKSILSNTFPNPGIEDGVRGMLFIEKALESSETGKWVKL